MINFLIDESYIKAFGVIMRQKKGIIMGGRISGWISDCSLMVDEFKYVKKLEKDGRAEDVAKFKGFSRYRDDCTVINMSNFMDIAKEMYPPSLELTQENEDFTMANVLDMKAKIVDGRFETATYCKTDDFSFKVISLPFLESNLSSRVCYLVFFSQILRYVRLTTNLIDFENRVSKLAHSLIDRGYKRNLLRHEFCRVVDKYRTEFEKWTIPVNSSDWLNTIIGQS